MIGPGGQTEQWYFWRVSFGGDTLPANVTANVTAHDDKSIIAWALDPRKAIQRAKEKCYGYGGKAFWDAHYEDNQIDVEPTDDPFQPGHTPMSDIPKVNVSELKPKPFLKAQEPERVPEPEREPEKSVEPNQAVQLSFLDNVIDKLIKGSV